MRYLVLLLLLAGCDMSQSRYQMSPGTDGAMWLLDAKTGELTRCTTHADRVSCAMPAVIKRVK